MADSMCPLLDKLPPELRNNIYELVFGPGEIKINTSTANNSAANSIKTKDIEVDLASAKPPAKDLILTCRQIYDEASKMYKAEYQRYWAETRFVLDSQVKENAQAIESLREEDVQHITSLAVSCGFSNISLLPIGG